MQTLETYDSLRSFALPVALDRPVSGPGVSWVHHVGHRSLWRLLPAKSSMVLEEDYWKGAASHLQAEVPELYDWLDGVHP